MFPQCGSQRLWSLELKRSWTHPSRSSRYRSSSFPSRRLQIPFIMQDRCKVYEDIANASRHVLNHPGMIAITSRKTPSSSTASYTLPHPTPITEELVARGVIPQVASRFSALYLQHAVSSKRTHEQQLNDVIHRATSESDPPSTILAICDAFKAHFHSMLAYWFDQTLLAYQTWIRRRRLALTSSAFVPSHSQPIEPVQERSKTFKPVSIPNHV